MTPITIALVVIVVLVLLVMSRGFRKVAAWLAVASVVISLAVYLIAYALEERRKSLIPIEEIKLSDFRYNSPGSGLSVITGRIENLSSQYTLTELGLGLSFRDCEGQKPKKGDIDFGDTKCVTIDEIIEIIRINVPPGQARDFKMVTRLGMSVQLKGWRSLHKSILHTKGK